MTQGNIAPIQEAPNPIDPGVRIGHVHLRTADIDRVRAFYVDVLGFDVVAEARDVPGWGTTGDILFVSAGGYHHHLGFNTWKSAGGVSDPDGDDLELAWDRPIDQWPRAEGGGLASNFGDLDIDDLLSEPELKGAR
jgi:catechol 2,3-dioxygenase